MWDSTWEVECVSLQTKHMKIHYMLFFSLLMFSATGQKPFLSNLQAGANFPIYTTYAAPMERSNYLNDEGYKFRFYIDSLGADFVTDNGGDLGLAFKLDGKVVYRVADMFKKPIITASYPDVVFYEMYPFEHIRAVCALVVYDSRLALLEVRLTNEGPYFTEAEVFTFYRNSRGISTLKRSDDYRQLKFLHTVQADAWTQEHSVAHIDTLQNVFGIREDADGVGVIGAMEGEAVFPAPLALPPSFDSMLITGNIYLPLGAMLVDDQPTCLFQLVSEANQDTILTERSGSFGEAVKRDGQFAIDATWLGSLATSYRVAAVHAPSGEIGFQRLESKEGKLPKGLRIQLGEGRLPPTVSKITVKRVLDKNTIKWVMPQGSDLKFSVYRRAYPSPLYVRIAKNVTADSLIDANLPDGAVFGYVVATQSRTGMIGMQSPEATDMQGLSFEAFLNEPERYISKDIVANQPDWIKQGGAKMLCFYRKVTMPPKEVQVIRSYRLVSQVGERVDTLLENMYHILAVEWNTFVTENEQRTKHIKAPLGLDSMQLALYWSAVNMMRQGFYQPIGKCEHPFYTFSREPQWGWGHGGQVMHESLSMLAFGNIDPITAKGSQRIFAERQLPNGYINYRTGPFLDEQIPTNGALTISAPWYAYVNNELYKQNGDRVFLKEMYESSKKYYQYIIENRDVDHDGFCEWGGNAVLESVRDNKVAVWDQVGDPANFEALDLNCMLVREAKALESMANALFLPNDAVQWKTDYTARAETINRLCWNADRGFYYHINRKNHSFTFLNENDLLRNEITGFLPLWAGVATPEQAKKLQEHITNGNEFARTYGLPSLSASDPYYNPKGYWNGPTWVQWSLLITRGLADYGYRTEAKAITFHTADGMIKTLQKTHDFWEFYSPDDPWGGYHKSYIWAGLIKTMLEETQ